MLHILIMPSQCASHIVWWGGDRLEPTLTTMSHALVRDCMLSSVASSSFHVISHSNFKMETLTGFIAMLPTYLNWGLSLKFQGMKLDANNIIYVGFKSCTTISNPLLTKLIK